MEQLVTIEVAKLAKELGFDEECDHVYEDDNLIRRLNYYEGEDCNGFKKNSTINPEYDTYFATAPSQAVLAKWLREKKDIYISMSHWIKSHENGSISILYVAEFIHPETYHLNKLNWVMKYEDVLENALLEALKYLRKFSQETEQKKEPKKM